MSPDDPTQLRRDLDEARRELRGVNRELGEIKGYLAAVVRLASEDEPAKNGRYPKAPQPTWYDLEDWVVSWMQGTIERRASNSRRWCPQWYEHSEVVTRFWALYNSWREMTNKDDALTYSTWFVDHLDRHLDAIFSTDGPFAACSPDRHTPHAGLTVGRDPKATEKYGPRPAPIHAIPPRTATPMEVKR
jgi:hypothetical protein